MKRRIFGLENEYGTIFTSGGIKTLPVEKTVGYLFEKLGTTTGFLNVFFENGARFYLDTGYHPEYATPECSNPLDVVKYDKAGERILESLLVYAERRAHEEGLWGTLSIFKNNTDFVGNSYGCHENYLVDRSTNFYALAELLIPFLVTRQIYAGAGNIVKKNKGVDFFISQRAQHIYQKISGATTNDRSIINTRDEPHADREKYRRLHVIVGDSNMSEYTTYLKMGVMALVLEMIEDNVVVPGLALRNPVLAIREVSHDVTCRRVVELEDGRRMRAVEIQRVYWEVAQRYFAERPLDAVGVDVLAKWGEVLDRLERDPMQLHREIDWVIKLNLLEAYRQRHHLPLDHDRVAMIDLQYHDIRQDRGLFNCLERSGRVERILTDGEIKLAMQEPPQDTRAKLRGDFIRLAKGKGIYYDLDWNYIRLGHFLNERIICNDPFQTECGEIGKLLSKVEWAEGVEERFREAEHRSPAQLHRGLGLFFYR